MSKQRLYYIETHNGCGIRAARNIQEATADARREVGENLVRVRRATQEDVDWVRQMGGYTPEGLVDIA